MFAIGMRRPIEGDDIYEVTNSMRSDQNTQAFAQLWELELRKKNPSIFRVMLKLHGFKVLTLGLLFSIGETLARYDIGPFSIIRLIIEIVFLCCLYD